MRRLEVRVHREVGLVPLAEDAEALEFALVRLNVARGKIAAHACGTPRPDTFAVLPPSSFSTFVSMGRPWQSQPGMYGARKPAMVFDFTIMSFRILLRPVPRWISPVGIRRPIVQHEQRRARARFENLAVETCLLPRGKLLRLALGQLGFHGKIGLRQIQSTFEVEDFHHLAGLRSPFLMLERALRCGRARQCYKLRSGNRNLRLQLICYNGFWCVSAAPRATDILFRMDASNNVYRCGKGHR